MPIAFWCALALVIGSSFSLVLMLWFIERQTGAWHNAGISARQNSAWYRHFKTILPIAGVLIGAAATGILDLKKRSK